MYLLSHRLELSWLMTSDLRGERVVLDASTEDRDDGDQSESIPTKRMLEVHEERVTGLRVMQHTDVSWY